MLLVHRSIFQPFEEREYVGNGTIGFSRADNSVNDDWLTSFFIKGDTPVHVRIVIYPSNIWAIRRIHRKFRIGTCTLLNLVNSCSVVYIFCIWIITGMLWEHTKWTNNSARIWTVIRIALMFETANVPYSLHELTKKGTVCEQNPNGTSTDAFWTNKNGHDCHYFTFTLHSRCTHCHENAP